MSRATGAGRGGMRVLVSGVGLAVGGGRTVGINFLRSAGTARPDVELVALVPAGAGYEDVCREHDIRYLAFPRGRAYLAWRLWFDLVLVPRLAREHGVDAIFSMGNHGPLDTPVPHVLLFHSPAYIYDEAEWGSRFTARERLAARVQKQLFAASARRAEAVIAQTRVAGDRLVRRFGLDADRVRVVPNAVTLEHADGAPATSAQSARMQEVARGRTKVLTLARYYPHKNLEFVVETAARLRDAGDDRLVFFITVEPEQDPRVPRLLDSITRLGLEDRVVNLGQVPFDALPSIYGEADLVFLPTLLESHSGSYLEALRYGVPIVTSDKDFAREACGDGALYIDPLDAAAAARTFAGLATDDGRRQVAAPVRVADTEELDWYGVAGGYLAAVEWAAGGRGTQSRPLPPPARHRADGRHGIPSAEGGWQASRSPRGR